ncbi:MAG: hypothetical protein ACYSW8_27355 [Planctomycetota bacterium]|jgi:hypothetical protein
MADNKLDKRIVELRRDLDIVSQIERQAQDRLDGKDEAWNKDREHAIEKMFNLVASVKPEDPPSKAVHVLGQLIAEVEKIRAPKRIILELDTKRKLLHTLQDQRRAYEDSRAKAQEAYDAHKLAMGS